MEVKVFLIGITLSAETCAGYPGVYGHEPADTKTFAQWGADSLKVKFMRISCI
jgi:hypothetical protein